MSRSRMSVRDARRPFWTRRSLLGAAAGLLPVAGGMGQTRPSSSPESRPAASTPPHDGANQQLRLGLLGCGERGGTLLAWVNGLSKSQRVTWAAVGDLWEPRRESAAERVYRWTGYRPAVCRNLDEMCERADLDAIVIATADFQHATLARQVIEAGKDVYVEKPFGCDYDQIRQARDVIRQSDRVFQVGTQRRSEGFPWAAREVVRAGLLGRISYVEMSQALFDQRWRIPGAENGLSEADIDWPRYTLYLGDRPFNARHYREFRLFWPYSTGIFCQWMSHIVDLVNFVLDDVPRAATALGGVHVWSDGRTNPDTVQALVEYPSGVLFSYHMRLGNAGDSRGLRFYGTRGTLDLDLGVAYGDGGVGEVVQTNPGAKHPEFIVDGSRRLPTRREGGVILESPPDGDHMVDFFTAIRERTPTRAGIDAAYHHALATTMAGMSLRSGRRMIYDADHDQISSESSSPADRHD